MDQPVQDGDTQFTQDFKQLNGIENEEGGKHTLGDTVTVVFTSLGGGTQTEGKVDSGATTSSLHADKISVNNNKVSFSSSTLGNRTFTLDLAGHQEVHSADGGANQRPVIKLDVEVDGVPLQGVEFNLNDRSNMDTPILLGQNVLKAGNFVIDVSKTTDEKQHPTEAEILRAVEVLVEAKISLADLAEYMRTSIVRNL